VNEFKDQLAVTVSLPGDLYLARGSKIWEKADREKVRQEQKRETMKVLALDLEMNQPSGRIIQVGAVIGDKAAHRA
jgi:hypothetical protein